jgi:hypothetical protein
VVLLAVGAAVLAGQWRIWRVTVDDTSAQDFGIFYASVRSFLDGGSLYAPIPAPPRFPSRSGQLNLNLPHTNLFFLPLGLLSRFTALWVWVGASLLAFLWSTFRSVRALHWPLSPLGWLALVVYLVAWGPAAAFTLTIQLNFLLMLPVTAAWLAARRGAPQTTGAWLGVAAAMKPFLLLFAPYCAIRRDTRALVTLIAAVGALVGIGLVVFGAGAYREWVEQLSRVTWATHYMNASVFAAAERVLGRTMIPGLDLPPALRAMVLVVAIALILALTLAGRTAHERRPGRDRSRLGGAAAGRSARLAAGLGLLPLDRALARRRGDWSRTTVDTPPAPGPPADSGAGGMVVVPADRHVGPAECAGLGDVRVDVFLGAALTLVVGGR